MVNRSAEVIVVGQVDKLTNFCPNMVRFRIRPDFFGRLFYFYFFLLLVLYFSFRFCFLSLSLLLYKMNLKLFAVMEISLFLMLSNEIQSFLDETNSENNTHGIHV